MHTPQVTAISLLLLAGGPNPVASFLSSNRPIAPIRYTVHKESPSPFSSSLFATLTPLPKDISPFDKSASKGRDVQGELRKLATTALEKALSNTQNKETPTLLELEFPPLIGGEQSKTQFDDFDNVQELNQNRDWCVQWLPTLASQPFNNGDDKNIWFVLPDTKEVELCKEEWKGGRYRQSAAFSSIEAVAQHYFAAGSSGGSDDKIGGGGGDGFSKPWGSTIANAFNQMVKGDDAESTSTGLLGDERALDSLTETTASLHLVCQPGNGGPVEDWINVKKLHEQAALNNSNKQQQLAIPTIVVNGALNKVRDGYYAPFIFPALAKTFDFYRSFQQLVFLKPVSDKGLYGWLFKVYGEPWQVFLQKPRTVEKGALTLLEVEDIRALVSDTKPSYQECIDAMLQCNAETN